LTIVNRTRTLRGVQKVLVGVRLDVRTKRRVLAYQKKVEKAVRVRLGFSEAVRALLDQSLDREGIR
jgi:hypothetical protein